MASFLSKFVRGAAEAGGELYADKARAQLRAKLLADRDTVLAGNREKVVGQQQAFESKQLTSRQEHDTSTAETLATGKITAAETKFGYDKELAGIRATSGTKTPADVIKVKALVASGRVKDEAEGWDYISSNANVPAKDIFKVLAAAQTPEFGAALKKGDEGYMSIEDMTKEAKRISSGRSKEDPTPKPDPGTKSLVDDILKDFKGQASEKVILKHITEDTKIDAATRADARSRLNILGR